MCTVGTNKINRPSLILESLQENLLVFLILTVYMTTFAGVMWAIKRPKQGKKKVQESSSDSVGEMFDTSSRGYKDIIKVKDNQIRSLTAKLNLNTEPDDMGIMYQVPEWEDVKSIAKTQGINPLLLEIPMVKKEVKKLIKGMTLDEITKNVGEFKTLAAKYGFKLGDKTGDKSKTGDVAETELNTTNFF